MYRQVIVRGYLCARSSTAWWSLICLTSPSRCHVDARTGYGANARDELPGIEIASGDSATQVQIWRPVVEWRFRHHPSLRRSHAQLVQSRFRRERV